jgi:hypothetical protein
MEEEPLGVFPWNEHVVWKRLAKRRTVSIDTTGMKGVGSD